MKALLYNFRWINETNQEFQASINGNFGRKNIKIGESLSLKVCSDSICAGHMINEKWQKCSQDYIGKPKCDICKSQEKKDNFVFTVFDGFNQEHLDHTDLEKISGTHLVYLAFFTKNLIKIGVSKLERKNLRQIEQGSFFTLYLAKTPDGISARKIETLIRKNGAIDKIMSSQKKALLDPEISETEAEKILIEIFQKHQKALSNYDNLNKFFYKKPEFISWLDTYNIKEVLKNIKPVHSVKLEKDESVSGKILAIRGPFLIIETPDELISICAKNLIGREISFDQLPAGLNLKTAIQGALF